MLGREWRASSGEQGLVSGEQENWKFFQSLYKKYEKVNKSLRKIGRCFCKILGKNGEGSIFMLL